MRSSHLQSLFITIASALLITSCSVTKDFKKPDVKTKPLYRQQVQLDSTTLGNMPWQELFSDPHLRDLIHEALQNNPDLQIAIQQIKEAQANLYQSKMSFIPSLNADGSASYNEPSDNGSSFGGNGRSIKATEQYSLSLSSSWEADIWGKLSSTKRAAYAQLLQSEAVRRAVQTTLIADVANSYYNLMALDAKLHITQQTVENRKQDVETMKQLKQSAHVTGAAVVQSMANRYSAEVTIPDIKQQIQEQENALSILLGRTPGNIERSTLTQQSVPDTLEVGVPAQLLRNRPDIIAAENAFRAAFETTNNARTYFYPSLTISAQGGFSSLNFNDLLKPGSIFANIIGGLTEPIFAQGRNKARLKTAKARQKEALIDYKNTVRNAGREVSDALNSYKHAEQKISLRKQQIDALQKSVQYSKDLLDYGNATYTDVLTSQQNLLAAQLSQVNDKLQQLTSVVSLYRSLGGGWKKSLDGD
ncbi:MAG TPA: efflux transporter outer membrane subunit [Balneolaceae bacterium]|nr:efflux transporter outer membrane subunit [Balneolaceae bacterium]